MQIQGIRPKKTLKTNLTGFIVLKNKRLQSIGLNLGFNGSLYAFTFSLQPST